MTLGRHGQKQATKACRLNHDSLRRERYHTNGAIAFAVIAGAFITPCLANSKGGGDHTARGVELAQQKQYDAAIAEFTKAIEAAPKDARAYTNRGTAYRASGKLQEAIADFSKAIEVSPNDEMAYRERGYTESVQNQFDAAMGDLDKAVQLKPDDGFAYKFRGFA